jgi:hypothetical protein
MGARPTRGEALALLALLEAAAGWAWDQARASGTIFDRLIRLSRVTKGTAWTTLVAAISSSAGSD